jgi:dimethylhistidine N-methyltransferase
MTNSQTVTLHDLEPETADVVDEVLEGLQQPQKSIPSKYLYDDRGAELFEEIEELEDYYPTRTEIGILQEYMSEITELLGPKGMLIEFGSGSGRKTRLLLRHLKDPVAYVPVDISRDQLLETAREIADQMPDMDVIPVCADYMRSISLPDIERATRRNIAFFPGSTIGNFEPAVAREFLMRIGAICRPRGGLLIGVDLKKDRRIIEAAYNDARGITAAFNLNLLTHLNREIGLDLDPKDFRHHAFYNTAEGRVEMHLISECPQSFSLDGTTISLEEGESICTEYSYKYSLAEFRALAESAGFHVDHVWTDSGNYFSVQYLTPMS